MGDDVRFFHSRTFQIFLDIILPSSWDDANYSYSPFPGPAKKLGFR